ncbi:MAG: response regulator transcription factor [Parvularculaceae bacterium]|nr:response regulator transcription factor [Parvularculaceae bacterium]
MTYRYAIIDDEHPAIVALKVLMQKHERFKLVGTGSSSEQAQALLSQGQIDLLFLDIEMPQMSGLDLLRAHPEAPVTIFVTAHPIYALEAFELGVRDYLTKPVSPERLEAAIQQVEPLLANAADTPAMLAFKDGHARRLLAPQSIDAIEAQGNLSLLHLRTGEACLVSESLSSLEQRLEPFGFLRAHRSFLVNRAAISSIASGMLAMAGGKSVPLGRRFRPVIQAALA